MDGGMILKGWWYLIWTTVVVETKDDVFIVVARLCDDDVMCDGFHLSSRDAMIRVFPIGVQT